MAKEKPLEEEMNLLVNHEAASSGRQTGVTGRRDDAGEQLRQSKEEEITMCNS